MYVGIWQPGSFTLKPTACKHANSKKHMNMSRPWTSVLDTCLFEDYVEVRSFDSKSPSFLELSGHNNLKSHSRQQRRLLPSTEPNQNVRPHLSQTPPSPYDATNIACITRKSPGYRGKFSISSDSPILPSPRCRTLLTKYMKLTINV